MENTMSDIIISEFMDEAAVEILKLEFSVIFDPTLVEDPERLLALGQGVRGLIVRNRTQVNDALLANFPDLQVVGRLGVGLDNIDLNACAARGVEVKPAIGGNSSSVAEYVIGGALMLRRSAYFSSATMLTGKWPRQALIGNEVCGSVLGLVGFGVIAQEIAHRALALGMEVIAFDPHLAGEHHAWKNIGRCDSLESLLDEADVISLHVPLTEETFHLIDTACLKRFKTTAVLINAARGGIVDEVALANILREGGLAGAMLDVFEQEPLRAKSVFEGIPNVILTPHIAGVTKESNARISQMTVDNVCAVLARRLGGAGK